jgi:hypothetical protein
VRHRYPLDRLERLGRVELAFPQAEDLLSRPGPACLRPDGEDQAAVLFDGEPEGKRGLAVRSRIQVAVMRRSDESGGRSRPSIPRR